LNVDGIQRITQLLLTSVLELADADKRQRFRTRSQQEFKGMRSQAEAALSPSPVRLGVRWSNDDDGRGGARLIEVTQGTPAAAAGLRVGDRILEFAGNKIERSATLLPLVLAAENPVAAVVERTGEKEPLQLAIRLGGQPIRVGITWRVDDAEPGVVQVARLTSGSPAHLAGLRVGDRIYRLNGETFGSSDEFAKLLSGAKGATDVEVESSGRIRTVQLTPLSILKAETRD
jgi:C-terminal processing protease CtpA/Prc